MKILSGLLLAVTLCMSNAYACDLRFTDGLTEIEVQEIKVLCEQKKAQALLAKSVVVPTGVVEEIEALDKETVDKIGAISEAIVKVVTETAKGLGVAANEFIQSPAGIFLSVLLVFYMAGSKILIVGLVIMVLLVLRWFLMFLYNRYSYVSEETVQIPRFWGLYSVSKTNVTRRSVDQWDTKSKSEFHSATGVCLFLFCVTVIVAFVAM